jgi:hypothetical protein
MTALFIGGGQDGRVMRKPPHSPWRIMRDPPEIDFKTGLTGDEAVEIDTYTELRLGDYFVYHCIKMSHSQALNQLLNHYKKP